MATVLIKQLKKIYDDSESPAIVDLNLSICDGEFFGMLGPNGAGKSTTISIICGLLKPTGGTVMINGIDIAKHPDRIKPLLGLVPQDIALYPSLTATENLTFFAGMYGLRGKELKRRVEECLHMVGLEKSGRQKIATFSGGMRRRTNLAAGLVHKPTILILDEPTVGVDVQSRSMIFENLRELNESGTTIIYATHYMEEAQQLCSNLAILDRGCILEEGHPDELISKRPGCSNLEEVFLEMTGRHVRD